MQKKFLYATLVLSIVFLSSCGIGAAIITNHNQNATEVHLNSNNFKVVDQVYGSSEAEFVFAIGAVKKRQLYQNAYADMLKKANLLNGSKAIINVVSEEHFSGFAPFYVKRTITVSAQVVEFTK